MRGSYTRKSTVSAMGCLLSFLMSVIATGVHAATPVAVLDHVQGTVMIDRGDGFAIARDGDVVYQGDRVLVMQASTGKLINDRCSLQLDSNSLHTLRDQEPCQDDGHVVRPLGPLYAAAIGVIKPKSEPEEPEPEEIEKPPTASQPDTTQSTTSEQPGETAAMPPPSGGETETASASAKRPSSNAILIGVGVAAALAAIGGGGGGSGNASTPDH